MIKLINQFGGKEDFLVLLMIITTLFIVNSLIKNKTIRIISAIFSSLFITAQTFSLYSVQSFIGYQFYVHANLRGVSGMEGLFIIPIIISILFFVILLLVNFKSYSITRNILLKNVNCKILKITNVFIISLLFLAIANYGNFISDTKTLLSLLKSNDLSDFNTVLNKYGMSDYIPPKNIECTSGNNIIVISMESLEKAFLNGEYSSLTPNLNRIKNEWSYFDLEQNSGSAWTSGSLYTYLTGFPAFFGIRGNFIFKTAYNSNITGITHALKKANYTISYMNGNADHSGIKEMLNVFQFDEIIDYKNVKKTGHESRYGLRDKDLFSLAKNKAVTLNGSEAPFALFISTTDTHYPDGIYDERMETVISPQKTDLEFTVASLDFLIGDFITFLEQQDILKNTTIYIFPDHLKMGDPTIFKNTGERSLYLITNAKTKDVEKDSLIKTYQIDLPKIILSGAKIEHNLKFLTDYISGDKDQYIRENINTITEINNAGLLRTNAIKYVVPSISNKYEEYKKDTLRYIAHGGGSINGYTYTNSLEALNLSYEKGFRLFELDIIKTIDGKYVAAHDWEKWKTMTGYTGQAQVSHDEFMSYKLYNKYTPLNLDEINNWFEKHPDAILVSDKINEPTLFSKAFIDPERLIMELFTEVALREGAKCDDLTVMPTQHLIQKLDWKSIIDLEIKYVAVSRFFIQKNKTLLKKLKENNIKVYVYSVNQDGGVIDSGMDEEYVTKYELDYVYGMYADDWTFK